MAGLLDGKRLLITGVITKDSMAFHVAQLAQAQGAEVVLSSFGRVRRMTERAAARLDTPVDVLELDVNGSRTSRPSPQSSGPAGAGSTASSTRSPSRPRMRSAAAS